MTIKNDITHAPAVYYWLFLAVSRSDSLQLPHREAVVAVNECAARKLLADRFILFFAGRLPVLEVSHA
ncbi:host cell division inhibitor Icd-like protein [Rouxiella chamberiensis]|jgi:hypothetical protein|nr:host cell division inhibitor Icd-like protein [Rouxiella chamberiensis]